MATGLRVGVAQFLYRNTGTAGTPVWNPITIAKDVKLGLEYSKAEIKSRASRFNLTLPAINAGPLEFNIIGDTSVDDFIALRDAQINRTALDLAIADDAIATTGTMYFRGDYHVYGFPVDQKLEDGEEVAITCDLAYTARNVATPPSWTDVS